MGVLNVAEGTGLSENDDLQVLEEQEFAEVEVMARYF